MIKDLQHTLKQTFLYGLSNIAIKAAGLIILPLYTRSLTVSEYGELALLELFAMFFVNVISLQIPSAFLRLGSDVSKNERGRLYFTALIIMLIFSAAFTIAGFAFSSDLSSLVFNSADYRIHFQLLTISIAIEILGNLPLQKIRLEEKSFLYLLVVALRLISLVALVWYFVVYRDEKVLGAIKAILFSNLLFFLATLPLQLRHLTFSFNKAQGLEMYRYGAPLVWTTIASVLLTISDRAIIKIFGQFEEVGIYTLAYKIGSLSNLLIIASFKLGFAPIAFKKLRDANFKPFFSKTLTFYIGINVLLTLVISIFGLELTKLLSSGEEAYLTAAILIPIIAYVFIFKALQNYFAYVFLFTKKTKNHAQITVLGVLINIGLNFLLIPFYGMYGAVASTGISYLIMSIVTFRIAQKQMNVQYENKRLILLMISTIAFIAPAYFLDEMSITLRVITKTAIILFYLLFLHQVVALKSEREKLKKVTDLLFVKGGVKKLLEEATK